MLKELITKKNIGLGCLIILLFVLMEVFSPYLRNSEDHSEYYKKRSLESQLKQIGQGLMVYANDNGDKFPEKLSTLYPDYISEIRIFFYPDDKSEKVTPENIDLHGCFESVRGLTPTSEAGPLLVYEKSNNHWKTPGRCELLVDGSVRWSLKKD